MYIVKYTLLIIFLKLMSLSKEWLGSDHVQSLTSGMIHILISHSRELIIYLCVTISLERV